VRKPSRFIRIAIAVFVIGAIGWLGHRPAAAQTTTGSKTPPLVIASLYGRDLFDFYCAPCHGRDGKGSGPVAPALKAPPADLTKISKANGGTFPAAAVESFVTGAAPRAVASHGSTDMPVWGPIFRSLDPNDAMTRARVTNIVGYIGSLQAK
jgi:mono/diheme cytochrome c family protein